MGTVFQSLGRTLAAGLVLLAVIVLVAGSVHPGPTWALFVVRWLHVVCGVMWLGLLWYFNAVQIPSMPKIPQEHRPAITQVIAPAALLWFRWSAAATVATGLLLAWMSDYILPALALQRPFRAIGIGMWLALVMAFNVWFILWPSQKKALGIVAAAPDEKARAASLALLTSRFNTMLSLPMLYCMVAQQNAGL